MKEFIDTLLGQEGILMPILNVVLLLLAGIMLSKLKAIGRSVLNKKTDEPSLLPAKETTKKLEELSIKIDSILTVQGIAYKDHSSLGEEQQKAIEEAIRIGLYATLEKVERVKQELAEWKEKFKKLQESGGEIIDKVTDTLSPTDIGKDL